MAKNKPRRAAKVAPQRYEDTNVDQLRAHPKNPNQGDVGAIVESIHENGFYGVIVAQRSTGMILAGEHRWRAAREAGLFRVPVMWLDCDDEDALRVLLADNRTSELGVRDPAALHELLRSLIDTPSGLVGTGYDADFLDELTHDLERDMADALSGLTDPAPDEAAGDATDEDEADEIPEADQLREKWQTARGQVWRLTAEDGAAHHAACIDSFSADERAALLKLAPQAPTLGLHDPPYGIGAKKGTGWVGYGAGWQGGNFDVKQKHYAPAIWDGEPFDPAPLRGITPVEVWWGVNWYQDKLPPSPCLIAWDKRVDLPSNSFADVELAWVNQDRPARVIRHRWFGCVKDSEHGEGRLHPTQKPVAVQAALIDMFSAPGDVVLDLFAGAGSTLLAAQATGRVALVAELSPAYLATILERATIKGMTAQLIDTLPIPEAPQADQQATEPTTTSARKTRRATTRKKTT